MEQHDIELISRYDGLSLHGSIKHATDPIAVMVIAHGMCEHRKRYDDFTTYLANHGMTTVIFDHRGHGESVHSIDDLGYFNDDTAQAIIIDLAQIIDFVHHQFDPLPIILLGHSMGTLISRVYAKANSDQINGLILTGSPSQNGLVDIAIGLTKGLLKIHNDHYRSFFMQRLVFGTYAKAFSQDPSTNGWLCADPAIVDAYDHDPYCNYIFTLDGFLNLFLLLKRTYTPQKTPIHNPNLATLFLAGNHDPCIVSTKKFHQAVNNWKKIGFTTVYSKLYPHDRHEILNEKDRLDVYRDILTFIHQHIVS